ncbi:exonuclease domain-containing protein [Rhodococcus ruber]|uniref:3'-5' exonuclease n=1 Tax=Rhodococcus ruber TaxID=1830 RepID=UPI00378332DB
MSRRVIVVDVETTGLDVRFAQVLEVAAVDLRTGELLEFVPHLDKRKLEHADPTSFAVNGYYERRVFERELDAEETCERYEQLHGMLDGATLAGVNPRFDAALLRRSFAEQLRTWTEPWHHRLVDLSSYAAGALGVDPAELPGLDECCALLGVNREERHSATADALDTAACFDLLDLRRKAGAS